VLLSGVVDRQPRELSKNLPRHEVLLACLEHGLGCDHIVGAVLHDLLDHVIRNRLVPGVIELHVVQTKVDLKLLQAGLD
jgi:hypothetical protein